MAITRLSNSGIKTGVLKYDSALAGYPPVMAAPTATDAGTGTSVNVAFTAVSGATSYTAISTPGSFTATGASSPLTVTGLSSGTAYTFQVRATNAVGTGGLSAASNSVTPVNPAQFESIASALPSGSTSVNFSGIPQTYKHLQVRVHASLPTGGNGQSILMTFNNTGIYDWHASGGCNGTTNSSGTTNQGALTIAGFVAGSRNDPFHALCITNILDYTDTSKLKVAQTQYGWAHNSTTTCESFIVSGQFNSTNAVTSVQVFVFNNFGSDTEISLYGIKG